MFVSHHATVLLQKAAGLESVEMLVRIYTCPLFSLVQICQTIKVFFIRIDVCFFFALSAELAVPDMPRVVVEKGGQPSEHSPETASPGETAAASLSIGQLQLPVSLP